MAYILKDNFNEYTRIDYLNTLKDQYIDLFLKNGFVLHVLLNSRFFY